MIKLMYITNSPEIAKIAERSGVERIFIDLEYIGKSQRQGGMDTVQNHHTIEDVKKVRSAITKSEILVRCNPIHYESDNYVSSKEEINAIIKCGADVVMLPYFKTVNEVKTFIEYVGGRAKTMLLIETPEAVECIDSILELNGIDEVFIGLNDLSLGLGKKFMFQLLVDGTVEKLCAKFKNKKIPYGFGGIAGLGKGLLPAEYIICEHYRLGSTCAILSRSFCNLKVVTSLSEIATVFDVDLKAIRNWEVHCASGEIDFVKNTKQMQDIVDKIIKN